MGTTYNIILQSDVSAEDAHIEAYNILQKVNQEMSTYIDDSLISKVNKADRLTILQNGQVKTITKTNIAAVTLP